MACELQLMRTAVVSADDAKDIQGGAQSFQQQSAGAQEAATYDPTCFRLPIPGVTAGETITLKLSYFEQIDYTNESFVIRVPMAYDALSLGGQALPQLVSLQCKINSGGTNCQLRKCSLPLRQYDSDPGQLCVMADQSQPWNLADFELNYSIASDEIMSSMICDADNKSFCVVVSPPTAQNIVTKVRPPRFLDSPHLLRPLACTT